MKIKSMICVTLMLGAATIASAQKGKDYNKFYASFVTGGASLSGIGNVKDDVLGTDKFGLNGFNVGYAHGFKLTGHLFLEGGLEFNYATGTESTMSGKVSVDDKTTTMSLAIPVNLTYNFAVSEKFIIAPLAGVNFKYNLSANEKAEFTGGSYEYNMFDSEDMAKMIYRASGNNKYCKGIDETANRFQFGINLGVNFVFATHYMLGYRFQYDISPFYKYEKEGYGLKLNTNYHYITLGYIF